VSNRLLLIQPLITVTRGIIKCGSHFVLADPKVVSEPKAVPTKKKGNS
jgi:hypothetical protein